VARDPQPVDFAEIQTLEVSKHAAIHQALLMKLMKPVTSQSTFNAYNSPVSGGEGLSRRAADRTTQWTPSENNYTEKRLALLARLMDKTP
jgi:hypothetical protein